MGRWSLLAVVLLAYLLLGLAQLLGGRLKRLRAGRPHAAPIAGWQAPALWALAFLAVAGVIDRYVPPWGTRLVGWLHVALAALGLFLCIYLAWQLMRRRT